MRRARTHEEQVVSSYGYLSGYNVAKSIVDQVATLKRYFSQIGTCDYALPTTTAEGTEGVFAIPKWQLIAPTYGEAVALVLVALMEQRGILKVANVWCRESRFSPEHLRETLKKTEAFKVLAEQQKGYDTLVVDAQFGIEHRDKSTRHAREMFQCNEFGLGAFEVGIMLLTHPERLAHYDDLWIDCAGDEHSFKADGQFLGVPCFRLNYDGQLEFGRNVAGGECLAYGSASGFLPQS